MFKGAGFKELVVQYPKPMYVTTSRDTVAKHMEKHFALKVKDRLVFPQVTDFHLVAHCCNFQESAGDGGRNGEQH